MTEKQYGGAKPYGFKGGDTHAKATTKIEQNSPSLKKKIEDSFDYEISKEDLSNYIKAGEISKKVKEYVKTIVKKDAPILEIAEKIESRIKELEGEIAFPTNISIDEVAAHYTPIVNDDKKATGLIKIDFGVEVNGFIADTAISFDLTEDKIHKEMIELNKFVLEETTKKLKVGSKLKEIGNGISELVEKDGRFKVIRNLTGHGLSKDNIHSGITVSNLRNENNFELNDIAIAIEPFLTTGAGEIYEGEKSDIYILENDKTPRDRDARKLLEFIKENYRTKPFCKRWLNNAGLTRFNFALSVMAREGILHNFPVLIEKGKKAVSQYEHTVVFSDKVYITTS